MRTPDENPVDVDVLLAKLRPMHCKFKKCDQVYTPIRHWQKFCSPQCRIDHFWSTHQQVTVPIEQ